MSKAFVHERCENADLTEASRTEFMTPAAFIFLSGTIIFFGLWHPDSNTNSIYITSEQDLII
ncbi:hypothetical protein HID58_009996 [Brassica napus]|uniref:Uncharacterized protein n=1 Tax=Brassica napus TaxID=3708 RepID=A0ABQ8DU86_BRANA|nr:hypothetical protein HID58_009996 [Brassica napus]